MPNVKTMFFIANKIYFKIYTLTKLSYYILLFFLPFRTVPQSFLDFHCLDTFEKHRPIIMYVPQFGFFDGSSQFHSSHTPLAAISQNRFCVLLIRPNKIAIFFFIIDMHFEHTLIKKLYDRLPHCKLSIFSLCNHEVF